MPVAKTTKIKTQTARGKDVNLPSRLNPVAELNERSLTPSVAPPMIRKTNPPEVIHLDSEEGSPTDDGDDPYETGSDFDPETLLGPSDIRSTTQLPRFSSRDWHYSPPSSRSITPPPSPPYPSNKGKPAGTRKGKMVKNVVTVTVPEVDMSRS
jgi:hypothetical protein